MCKKIQACTDRIKEIKSEMECQILTPAHAALIEELRDLKNQRNRIRAKNKARAKR